MWPVGVEAGEELVEPGLLLEHVGGRRFGRFALQGEVHALMAAILLGVAGFDPFDLDAEAQPPDRELAQPVDGMRRGKRDAVVGANHLREAKLLEGTFEDREGKFLLRRQQRLASEEVATGEVGDGQRIAVFAIAEQKLVFVAGTPPPEFEA